MGVKDEVFGMIRFFGVHMVWLLERACRKVLDEDHHEIMFFVWQKLFDKNLHSIVIPYI